MEEIASPWCLKLLRSAGQWSHEDLAVITGIAPDLLADLEEGRHPLTRKTLAGMIARLCPGRAGAVFLLSAVPRAQPWRYQGPDLSEDETRIIDRLIKKAEQEARKLLIDWVRAGNPASECKTKVHTLMAEAGIPQALTEQFVLEMLLLEADRWEAL